MPRYTHELAVGETVRTILPTGLTVDLTVARDADGGLFVQLGGVDCNLEGEQPGMYYLTALGTEDGFCPKCGCDDIGTFAANEDREDCGDISECHECGHEWALTPEGQAELNDRADR